MTLSLYSTYRAWRQDVAAGKTICESAVPAALYSALALLGAGVGGMYSMDLPDAHEAWLGIG